MQIVNFVPVKSFGFTGNRDKAGMFATKEDFRNFLVKESGVTKGLPENRQEKLVWPETLLESLDLIGSQLVDEAEQMLLSNDVAVPEPLVQVLNNIKKLLEQPEAIKAKGEKGELFFAQIYQLVAEIEGVILARDRGNMDTDASEGGPGHFGQKGANRATELGRFNLTQLKDYLINFSANSKEALIANGQQAFAAGEKNENNILETQIYRWHKQNISDSLNWQLISSSAKPETVLSSNLTVMAEDLKSIDQRPANQLLGDMVASGDNADISPGQEQTSQPADRAGLEKNNQETKKDINLPGIKFSPKDAKLEDGSRSSINNKSATDQVDQKYDALGWTNRLIFGEKNIVYDQLKIFNHQDVQAQTDGYRLPDQVLKQVKLLISEGKSQISFQLEPQELGRLTLKISLEKGIITAKFAAANLQVKSLIESSLVQLRQSLEDMGLKESRLEVGVGQHFLGEESHGQQRQGQAFNVKKFQVNSLSGHGYADDVSQQVKPVLRQGSTFEYVV